MRGVDVSQDGDGGVTLAALNLDQGFYRTSAESRDILECHHPQACSGGVDPSQYCEEGYQGACEPETFRLLQCFESRRR